MDSKALSACLIETSRAELSKQIVCDATLRFLDREVRQHRHHLSPHGVNIAGCMDQSDLSEQIQIGYERPNLINRLQPQLTCRVAKSVGVIVGQRTGSLTQDLLKPRGWNLGAATKASHLIVLTRRPSRRHARPIIELLKKVSINSIFHPPYPVPRERDAISKPNSSLLAKRNQREVLRLRLVRIERLRLKVSAKIGGEDRALADRINPGFWPGIHLH